jgi:hypothetical protein
VSLTAGLITDADGGVVALTLKAVPAMRTSLFCSDASNGVLSFADAHVPGSSDATRAAFAFVNASNAALAISTRVAPPLNTGTADIAVPIVHSLSIADFAAAIGQSLRAGLVLAFQCEPTAPPPPPGAVVGCALHNRCV